METINKAYELVKNIDFDVYIELMQKHHPDAVEQLRQYFLKFAGNHEPAPSTDFDTYVKEMKEHHPELKWTKQRYEKEYQKATEPRPTASQLRGMIESELYRKNLFLKLSKRYPDKELGEMEGMNFIAKEILREKTTIHKIRTGDIEVHIASLASLIASCKFLIDYVKNGYSVKFLKYTEKQRAIFIRLAWDNGKFPQYTEKQAGKDAKKFIEDKGRELDLKLYSPWNIAKTIPVKDISAVEDIEKAKILYRAVYNEDPK